MTDLLHCPIHFAACVLVIGLLGTPVQSLADSPSKAVTTEEANIPLEDALPSVEELLMSTPTKQLMGQGEVADSLPARVTTCAPSYGPGHPYHRPKLGTVTFNNQRLNGDEPWDSEIEHQFRRMNAYVTSCYENLLLNGALLEGAISVEIHIDQGRAQSVEQPDTIQDPRLLQCVQKQLSKTRFSSQDVQTLLLNYVFALNK